MKYIDLKCMSKTCFSFHFFFITTETTRKFRVSLNVYFSNVIVVLFVIDVVTGADIHSVCLLIECANCFGWSMNVRTILQTYIYICLSTNIYEDDDGSRIMKLVCDNMKKRVERRMKWKKGSSDLILCILLVVNEEKRGEKTETETETNCAS